MKKVRLIIANYKEDISWVNNIDPRFDCIVYHKGDPEVSDLDEIQKINDSLYKLPNIGRESHTYIKHIVENYDKLADVEVFLQGNPFDHVPDLFKKLSEIDENTDFYEFSPHRKICCLNEAAYEKVSALHPQVDKNDRGSGSYIYLTSEAEKNLYEMVHGEITGSENEWTEFGLHGMFAISAQRIKSIPLNVYEQMLSLFTHELMPFNWPTINPLPKEVYWGYAFEYSWNLIFGKTLSNKSKVGVLIIATNRYNDFVNPLIKSADQYFLSNQEVTYFLFTNENPNIETNRNVVLIPVEHSPWPWMTLGRYFIFENYAKQLSEMDYLFYCDADMRFVGEVGDEILSDRVATQHPGYRGTRGTPETRPESTACVYDHEPMQYFAGGFNGGTSYEYLKMATKISANIRKDLDNNVIAVWHDESHMNRYFIDVQPTKVLDPSYCCPEPWTDYPSRKLLALEKNHNKIRE